VTSTEIAPRLSPAYWRLWTASTISNLGDGVFLVALPLLASRLTRSEVAISFIGVAAALPWLVLSLPIGAVVDRIDHRLLMVRADTFRAAIVGTLAIAVAADSAHMWMLWVAAACLGVAEVFFDNASQAMVPSIVPTEVLEKANGRRFASEIADKLYQLAHTNRLGRLVIVAPPKILGTLRQSLHKEVLDHIEAEVPKELASMPVSAIQQQIATW